MGADTKIEWADSTFNPWVGCTKVSPACDHCYAAGWAKRTGHPELWAGERRRTSAANWQQPRKWNKAAALTHRRPRVFCASLADVFDNQVPERWRDDLWHLIDQTPLLDWLLLTKRPQNIAKMLPTSGIDATSTTIGAPPWGDGWPNVWLGTTVENQEEADRRIPNLLDAPARVRFLSCEPLLGPLDLREYLVGHEDHGVDLSREPGSKVGGCIGWIPPVDWVITGGESGSVDARPMDPAWARSLRDQCQRRGVPFLFKQWGDWAPHDRGAVDSTMLATPRSLDQPMQRFGKKMAGRSLDGRTWTEFPA